jgi:hypothetical protein
MIILSFYGTAALYILAYTAVFSVLLARAYLTQGLNRVKVGLTISYAFILVCQIVFVAHMLVGQGDLLPAVAWSRRVVCSIVTLLPFVIARYVVVGKYAQFYLPSVKEAGMIGFSEFKEGVQRVASLAGAAKRTKDKLTVDNVREIFGDIQRHDSFNYINDGTLTKEYFRMAEQTLADPHMYLVLSSTGSAANEVISVFTNKTHNHASLAFDRDLETTISYNGGDRVYPPGLNPEMISHLTRGDEASVFVYSLKCTPEQKASIIERVREINENGSAYNMLGLVAKRSYRPNIMFCSQFVYRMLSFAGLAYFEKHDGRVRPTDFVTEDYRRALSFEYELEI